MATAIRNMINKLKDIELNSRPVMSPPLVVWATNDDEILGFQCGEASIMREPGESVEALEHRFVAQLGKGRAYILKTAITRSWGPWPYMPALTEDEWLEAAGKQQRESRAKANELWVN